MVLIVVACHGCHLRDGIFPLLQKGLGMFDTNVQIVLFGGDPENIFVDAVEAGGTQVDHGRHAFHRHTAIEPIVYLLSEVDKSVIGLGCQCGR